MRKKFGVAPAAHPDHPADFTRSTPAPAMVPAQPCRFPHLQQGYYEKFRIVFQDGGYRHLGDYELPERNQCPQSLDAPTMLRFLTSPSGHITATYCHLVPRLGRRIRTLATELANLRLDATRDFLDGLGIRHVVHLQTEFDDGSFLLTTNASPVLTVPTGVEAAVHPAQTSPGLLLKAHRKRVSEIIRSGSGRTPVPVKSHDDLLRMQERLHAARASQGMVRAAARPERHPFPNHRAQRAA